MAKILPILLLSTVSMTALAEKESGFYAGLQGGITHQSVEIDARGYDAVGFDAEIRKISTSSNQFTGGIYGGYFIPLNKYRIYFEALGNIDNSPDHATMTQDSFQNGRIKFVKEYTLGAAINFEFSPYETLSPFFKAGVVHSRFKLAHSNAEAYPAGKEHTNLWGVSLGTGLRVVVANNFSVRLQYQFNNYEEYKSDVYASSNNDTIKFDVRARDHNLTVGLHYEF